MFKKYLEKLEYNAVLENLQNFAKTKGGKNLCVGLLPINDFDEIAYIQQETTQALNLILRNGNIPMEEIPDISLHLKYLESSTPLTLKMLLEVCFILKLSREIKEYFSFDNSDDCNLIANHISRLYSNLDIEQNILTKIIDENTLDDHASKKLYSIRNSQKNLKADVKNKLNHFIHSGTYSKYLQDSIITFKNDRFVIPVKAEYRGQIKGFVHDISSSRFYSFY